MFVVSSKLFRKTKNKRHCVFCEKLGLVALQPLIGIFRFDYEYEYDYEIRHFWRQLLASSPADVIKS